MDLLAGNRQFITNWSMKKTLLHIFITLFTKLSNVSEKHRSPSSANLHLKHKQIFKNKYK